MSLVATYRKARRDEEMMRLRRLLALRAMLAEGMTQREIAEVLGVSQPAISQQLKATRELDTVHSETLFDAAAPVLRALAEQHGYSRLAAFGSVARHDAAADSDIDLIVECPPGTSTFGFLRFKELLERVLGREIDLVDYGGLKSMDDDIRREAVVV
jgi:predicted nucleotidyltransferase